MNQKLTAETPGKIISGLPPGPFKTLLKTRPSGALQVRKQASGLAVFFWRYSIGTKSERVAIGVFDPAASPKSLIPTEKGYSVAAATRAAETLALEHYQFRAEGGRPALIAASKEAEARTAAAKLEAQRYTLQNLLTDYADYLESLGRSSHKDVRSIFKLHVIDPWPEFAAMPANKVSGEQIADMMRRVIGLGKARTSNKLRSYIRSAYQTAKSARSKPSVPVKFKDYNVTHNPGADTEPDEGANKADKRPLSIDELRHYWRNIKHMDGFRGAVLRLHLLTGGQRIKQLVSLRTDHVFGDKVTLFDGKGRPGKPPRPHTVPLLPLAAAALIECKPQGVFAISTDKGVTNLAATTLSAWAVAAGSGLKDFQAKRIRSGIETLLASARISSDIRGRLQSHGIGGVQARHYDGHDYLDDKRGALEVLLTLLEAPATSATITA